MAKKKSTETVQDETEKKSFFSKIKITKQHKILFGFLLVLFSIALFFAFISFFIYWREDQSTIGTLAQRSVQAKNWLGKFGAELSHFFIYGSFGVASFLFVRLFFITGIYLIMSLPLQKLKNSWFWDMFALLIVSISFGFLFQYIPELSGVVGFELNDYLQDYLGKIGTMLILIFGILIYLIFRLRISPETIQAFFEKRRSEIKEELNDYETNDVSNSFDEKQISNTIAETPQSEENSESKLKTSQFEVDKSSLKPTIQKSSEISWNANEKENLEEISLQIENTQEEDELDSKYNLDEMDEDDESMEIELKTSEVPIEEEFIIEEAVQEATLEENLSERLVADFGEFDPTLELSNYKFPTIDLLKDHASGGITINQE